MSISEYVYMDFQLSFHICLKVCLHVGYMDFQEGCALRSGLVVSMLDCQSRGLGLVLSQRLKKE